MDDSTGSIVCWRMHVAYEPVDWGRQAGVGIDVGRDCSRVYRTRLQPQVKSLLVIILGLLLTTHFAVVHILVSAAVCVCVQKTAPEPSFMFASVTSTLALTR